MRDVELKRSLDSGTKAIKSLQDKRTAYELISSEGDSSASSTLRRMQSEIADCVMAKDDAQAAIFAKYARPIKLSEDLELKRAAKMATVKRKRRMSAKHGKGINSQKRVRAAELLDDDDSDEACQNEDDDIDGDGEHLQENESEEGE